MASAEQDPVAWQRMSEDAKGGRLLPVHTKMAGRRSNRKGRRNGYWHGGGRCFGCTFLHPKISVNFQGETYDFRNVSGRRVCVQENARESCSMLDMCLARCVQPGMARIIPPGCWG